MLRETKSYNWWEDIERKCLPEVNSYSQPPNSPFCAYTHSTEISLCWFNKVCACIRNASTPGRFVRLLGSFIFLLVENKSAPVFHFRIKTNKQTKSVLSVTGDRLEAVTARRWRAATTKKNNGRRPQRSADDLFLRDFWTYMDGRKPDSALEQKVLVKDSQYFTPELG